MPQKKTQKDSATVIDGKKIAQELRASIARHVEVLIDDHKIMPGLAVVLVGEDPASVIYVRNKEKAAKQAGMRGVVHRLPKTASQDEVLKLVPLLTMDKKILGNRGQMPLPKQIDAQTIPKAINPIKDIDGLGIENTGRLSIGLPGMVPCTPMGCLALIKSVEKNLTGLHAVVVGRSSLVGKPVAQLLLRENCTVTMCHSRTPNLSHVTRLADILVVAVGKPKLVKADWVKPGAIVVDVGINRQNGIVVGDVDDVSSAAGYVTPVPGGVGPMTIACLLGNTVIAACRQNELTVPHIG